MSDEKPNVPANAASSGRGARPRRRRPRPDRERKDKRFVAETQPVRNHGQAEPLATDGCAGDGRTGRRARKMRHDERVVLDTVADIVRHNAQLEEDIRLDIERLAEIALEL